MPPHLRTWTLALLTLLASALALPGARARTVEADHGGLSIEYVDAGFTCADVDLIGPHFDAANAHFTLWISREGSAPDGRLDEGTFTAEPEEEGDGYAFALGPYNPSETGDPDGYDVAITWHDGAAHELHAAFDGQ